MSKLLFQELRDSKKKTPKKRKHRRAIVIPDCHFPLQYQPAVNCVLKAIEMIKPNIFICLGDLGEWHSVSPFKYKRRKRPPLEYILKEVEKEEKQVPQNVTNNTYNMTGFISDNMMNEIAEKAVESPAFKGPGMQDAVFGT